MMKALSNFLLNSSASFRVMLIASAAILATQTRSSAAEPTTPVTQLQIVQPLAVATKLAPTPLRLSTTTKVANSTQSITTNRGNNKLTVTAETSLGTENQNVVDPGDPDSEDSNSDDPMAQVTSVSQLSDVKPTDWAFQSLQSLVERYGCIVGYPNRTYRGNRALTRYEFAAGLNACLNRVNELIAAATSDLVRREDIDRLRRLQDEFGPELASLRGRVDVVEARTAQLETQQFSTTTKLNAVALFIALGIPTGQNANGGNISHSTALGSRTRLNFESSFTGKDLLRTRLQFDNLNALSGTSTATPEGDLRFTAGAFVSPSGTGSNSKGGVDNSVVLDQLLYQFPLGDKTMIYIDANAGANDDFSNTVNPYLDGDGDTGALTHFGTRNPIGYLLNNGLIGLRHQFSDQVEFSIGYAANIPNFPTSGNGGINGPYGALAQLTLNPIKPLTVGLTYVHAYNNEFTANASTGSNRANLRSALQLNPNLPTQLQPFGGLNLPISNNSYGLEASYQVNPKLVVGGWVGLTKTRTLTSLVSPTTGAVLPRGDLDILNFAGTLALPDFLKKGSLAGLIIGMEPKVTGVTSALRSVIGKDRDTSVHVEGFYQYNLTDNIAITPGLVLLTAPDHNSQNAPILIGVIRTAFTF